MGYFRTRPVTPLFSDDVPFVGSLTDNGDVILLDKNTVLAGFEVDGVYPTTASDQDVARWYDQLHNAWRGIAASDVSVTVYQCRGYCDPSMIPVGTHQDAFAASLAADYRNGLFKSGLFMNRLFLLVQIKGPTTTVKAVKSIAANLDDEVRDEIADRAHRLDDVCRRLQSSLREFGLKRLQHERRGKRQFDQIAEAVVFAFTGIWRPVPVMSGRLGRSMFSEEFRFKRRRITIEGPGAEQYASVLTSWEYPAETEPGMWFDMARAPYRCTLVQVFEFLSNADGQQAISRKQNKMEIAGDPAYAQKDELLDAANDLISRKFVMGHHGVALIVFCADKSKLDEVSEEAHRDFANCGMKVDRLSGPILQCGFIAGIPGNFDKFPRPGTTKSGNFVAMCPLFNFPMGNREGHWPGGPIATLRTLEGTPVFMHWHQRDVGNTLLTGFTGSGKTASTSFLLTMSADRARVIGLDHKRGWQFLMEELGGAYGVLEQGRPCFAPLKALPLNARTYAFMLRLLRGMIGGKMSEEENRALSLGLRTVWELPAAKRFLWEVRAFLDSREDGAGYRLERWCWGNELGWVMDAPKDSVDFSRLCALDTTEILDHEEACGPGMTYLMFRISLMLDGTPLLIPIDEGWKALRDPIFRRMIDKLLRTIRSKNGAVVFITQSPGDIVEADLARVLIEMCPTQMHLNNRRARRDDYINGFRLTEGQYEAFSGMDPTPGTMLMIQGDKSVVAQIPMAGLEKYLPILSAPEADLVAADAARRIANGDVDEFEEDLAA